MKEEITERMNDGRKGGGNYLKKNGRKEWRTKERKERKKGTKK